MKKFQDEAYGYIKDMFAQHHMVKRVVLSLISIIVMGFGISMFSLSGFGVDPFTSMNMNIASTIGMGFGTYQLIINLAILTFVIIVAHRGLVGVGTVFNMVGCGYTCEFFQSLFAPAVNEHYTYALRVPLLIVGIITLCFACSLFFTANVGVGPYDALSFMLARSTKFEYKWMRVATDVTVVLIGLIVSGGAKALLSGDISKIKNIGIGTIITAFCMGPLINFFNKYVSAKIEKLRDMYGDLKLSKAFEMADNVLTIAAKSIAEIITLKGFVNVDFADVEVVMRNSGVALMGAGESVGENRALEAVKMALESPLLNSNDIRGASNILLNMLYGSKEITMDEITLITDYVKELVGNDVDVIWGAGKDDALGDELHVAVIATGFNGSPIERKKTNISFKVETVEDLEMQTVDARKLEEEERARKQRLEESRRLRQQREKQRRDVGKRQRAIVFDDDDDDEPVREEEIHRKRIEEYDREFEQENGRKRGKNEVPDVDSWFKRKLGNMFNEDMNRDSQM